ncbi:MAG TPA: ABC transporter permease subunit [Pirellulales bacterium]|jgi:ABC-2 type transport system permease protein|nr:ABC transporter permease subunit [Pirellulales bacterium]
MLALWQKAFRDARLLWLCLAAALFGFNWLFVALTSLIKLGALGLFLQSLPKSFEDLAGMPLSAMATTLGHVAMVYVHPVVTLCTLTWAVARGSDAVSGEIGRGTMEMLLAQPVRRSAIVLVSAAVTMVGAAGLAAGCWLGDAVGIATTELETPIEPARLLPGALNLFAYTVFVAAIATLASACDSQRWRTIGVVGAFYVLELILKVTSQMAPRLRWLRWFSFLTWFEPHALIVDSNHGWSTALHHSAWLLGLAAVAYAAAVAIFCRRDLPAPL